MCEILKLRSKDFCELNCPFSERKGLPMVGSATCSECKFNGGSFVFQSHKYAYSSFYKIHNEPDGVYVICFKKAYNHPRRLLTEKKL